LLHLFKTNMVDFIDELIEQFEDEGDLIVMRFFFAEQIPIENMMTHFITYIYPFKEMIHAKNEQFFLERDNIFGSSPKEKVIHFKSLYNKMSEEDKKTLWIWFESFISICDKYVKL